MKRTEIQSVGDILRQVLTESNMSGKLAELKAAELWPQLIGTDLASRCMKPYVKDGIMTIRVLDAPLRQEFHMQRSSMVRALNRILEIPVIKDIRFVG